MSPNEPLPILRIRRYLLLTKKSAFDEFKPEVPDADAMTVIVNSHGARQTIQKLITSQS